jgi:hypothetical protein
MLRRCRPRQQAQGLRTLVQAVDHLRQGRPDPPCRWRLHDLLDGRLRQALGRMQPQASSWHRPVGGPGRRRAVAVRAGVKLFANGSRACSGQGRRCRRWALLG